MPIPGTRSRRGRLGWAGLCLCLLLQSISLAAQQATLQPYRPGSHTQLLQAHQGRPLLLVFWSLDCPPCRRELAMLGRLARQHTALPLVLVSVDGMAAAPEAVGLLRRHGLETAENWLFDGPEQRLRFDTDPGWYGELPRSYFLDAEHQRTAHSGVLTREQVLAWLSAQMAKTR